MTDPTAGAATPDPAPRPLTGGEMVGIALLVLVSGPLTFFAGGLALAGFREGFEAAFFGVITLAAAAAPLVVLLATRGRRVGLAWGVFLMGLVVGFGACVMVFSQVLF